jgi:RNA polymerase sigma factor (sigma-70 family)
VSIDAKTEAQVPALQRAGDYAPPLSEAACSDLVTRHGPMVKSACQRILHDAALAEDAAQEVFLLLVRKLPSLPPQTILGGWLYVTACHLARTYRRTHTRRWQRENQPEVMENLMNPAQDPLWRELGPLLDDAMVTLSQRQRELVLFRYFQNNTQRAAAGLVGCSESVASRELAAAIEGLRKYFARHGVTVSGTALITLLSAYGAQASIGTATVAAALSSASALAGTSAAGTSLFFTLMKTTTSTKIVIAAAALLLTSGTVHYFTQPDVQTAPPNAGDPPAPSVAPSDQSQSTSNAARTPAIAARPSPPVVRPSALSAAAGTSSPTSDEAAQKSARDKLATFQQRISQLALVNDPVKVQDLLFNEYGIRLSVDEIRTLQPRGQKGFSMGVIELWASKQPQEALAFAASTLAGPNGGGGDFHQLFLEAARKSLPDLNRETLDRMLADSPGKAKLLDLAEASTDPASLANRILAVTDPDERASRLRVLAQGWSNPETSTEWARQNLSGADKTAFYSQVGYNLAHQNPQAGLQVLAELQGTEAYASTFGAMMRGLVQEGGLGQQAAELIANANVNAGQRAELISELARRWVRKDPDATVVWANSLTAPEDFRAAIPLLVSQLDNERVSRTVNTYLKNHDPVMELALIEAAAPPGLYFDPEKSRLILDPLINRDPALKLTSVEGNGSSREEMLWSSVNQTAKRQAEEGRAAAAMEWLAKLPFTSPSDYAKTVANVFSVWNLKSETEAAAWLRNSALDPALKADLQNVTRP